MAKKWRGLLKAAEECNELTVELMKLEAFPDGVHPGRKKNLKLSAEDECADVLAAVEYFIARNKLDVKRIERRKKAKWKKFCGWWGDPFAKKVKKRPEAKIMIVDASSHVETS